MKQEVMVMIPLLFLLSGCIGLPVEIFEPRTDSESVELGEAEMVQAELIMPVGELEVTGGAQKLLEADYTYNSPSLRPEATYNVTGFRGRLIVDTAGHRRTLTGKLINRWNLRLNNNVPLDLHVKFGAGEGKLRLAGLSLRSVDIEMGVGEMMLDLTGDWDKNFEVKIRGGVGEVEVRLPHDVGVIAEARGGIGEINVRSVMVAT